MKFVQWIVFTNILEREVGLLYYLIAIGSSWMVFDLDCQFIHCWIPIQHSGDYHYLNSYALLSEHENQLEMPKPLLLHGTQKL